jgi:hypothetical protein
MQTGKTYSGIKQVTEKERERGLEVREKYHWWGKELALVDLTIGKINT